MKKALFAWIGKNDLVSAANDGKNGLGAICQAMTTRHFDQAILLSNYSHEETSTYCDWLTGRNKAAVSWKVARLEDPTDFRLIYDHAKKEVSNYINAENPEVELTFHLSPGTPSMATVWIILANSVFPARLIQTSQERGLKDVELPFDIAVDYLPDLMKRRDEKIGKLFDRTAADAPEFRGIIHRSNSMTMLIAKARKVAPHFLPVLIQGESGTGKELLAEAIHMASLCKGRFIAVNCGAIPSELIESELFGHKKGSFTGATTDKPGYIKSAAGGTLFLDEIGELPLAAQVKLLRVLQERKFTPVGATLPEETDARVIAATNRNLLEEVAAGRFREDLFHRLAVAILAVPPLREREGDIGLLLDHLLERTNERLATGKGYNPKKLSASAKSRLLQHSWPGNVRELQNTLLRAALWASAGIERQDVEEALLLLPRRNGGSDILGRPLEKGLELEEIIGDVARHYLERALKESGGNKTKAAGVLGFKNYQTFDNWLKKYSISFDK